MKPAQTEKPVAANVECHMIRNVTDEREITHFVTERTHNAACRLFVKLTYYSHTNTPVMEPAMNALTTPNKTLFLSYSRQQTAWCDDLYTAIDTYTHYYRWRDNKIPESSDWWDSICLNIEGCYAFIAILTQDYLDSVYCMGELEYVLKLNKPVIALMLEDVDYPQKLNEKRLQFARVNGLPMPQVITKVLNACNQITLGYMQDEFSTDIHPRQHLRPRVPTPKKSTPTPEEDAILSEQIEEVSVHGQIPTRDLIRRYTEEKERNVRLARDLLDKIADRKDVPVFFDVEEENTELQAAEKRLAEQERERQRIKKIRGEYDDLAHYVSTARPKKARRAIQRFMEAYPDFGNPKELMQQFRPKSIELMPKPFDWIEIPGGSGMMKTDTSGVTLSIPDKDYSIAKYPVTNAQFAKFIEAGGYTTERWWTEQGWKARKEGWHYDEDWKPSGRPWTEPRYWQDSKWNGVEQPVVGVSWYEAVAFCLWLSEITGENIMLPTEDQWQYAAQGDYGRKYPWGNEWDWDCYRCNNSVKPCNSNLTTSVTHYEGKEKGNSPFSVVDMSGNVWEWCRTDFENKTNGINFYTNSRVLRGGSWGDNDVDYFRCYFRGGGSPPLRDFYFGFRLSCF